MRFELLMTRCPKKPTARLSDGPGSVAVMVRKSGDVPVRALQTIIDPMCSKMVDKRRNMELIYIFSGNMQR